MARLKIEWTGEQIAVFEQMFLAGDHLLEIANELGVALDRIVTRAAGMPMEQKDIRRRIVRTQDRAKKLRPVVLYSRHEPTPEALEDRDRRYHSPRTITAEFFGDPRAGQSALDKRAGA